MSEPREEHWSWEISHIDDLSKSELQILIKNRGYTKKLHGYRKMELIKILSENYEVEDKSIKSFALLTIKQLKAELELRNI